MNATDTPHLSTPLQLHLACPAELPQLPTLLALADRACSEAGAGMTVAYAVRLAVEEAVANIIAHGYGPTGQGSIDLTIAWNAEHIRVDIRDQAPPFDPAQVPPPDLDSPWETRNPGGIGWALINQLMDSVAHQYHPDTGNHLTLTKDLAP